MKTPQEHLDELAADVKAAHAQTFPPAAQHLQAVRDFYEIRGHHNRGRIGDCALVTAHKNALKACQA